MGSRIREAQGHIQEAHDYMTDGMSSYKWQQAFGHICSALALLTSEPEPCDGHDGINNCLHCGGRAEIVHGMQDGWIACSKCGVSGPRRSSDEDAIAAWNRSYATKVSDKRVEELRAQVETLREALGKYANEGSWTFGAYDAERVWHEPDSVTPESYAGYELARKALAATEPKPCTWTEEHGHYESDGIWNTTCGQSWSFIDGGPEDNGVKFCHGCGKPVAVVPFVYKEEDDDD